MCPKQGTITGAEVTDPNWMMLVPLVIFAGVIICFGFHPVPLMKVLRAIGGKAG